MISTYPNRHLKQGNILAEFTIGLLRIKIGKTRQT